MENEKRFYHLSTDGMSSDILFKSVKEFIAGMNRIGLCSYLLGLQVFAFVLMDNHIHLVLYATYDECCAFFNKFKQKMGLWRKFHGSEERVFNNLSVDIRPIETEDYLKNVIVYDIMNPTKAFMPFTPQGYRWSSANLYFSDFSEILKAYKNIGDISARERSRLLGTREQIPGKWLISEDGQIWPGCYTNYKYVNSLMKNPFEIISRSGQNIEFRINKDMAEGKLSIPDMEILEICKAVSRGMYGTDRISELNVDQRITLAKDLRGRTRASYKQLAKVVRINYEDILSVFKGKR